MESRREFIVKSALAAAACALPAAAGCITIATVSSAVLMKTRQPEKPLVLWYSQTGYTARHGKLLVKTFAKLGLAATGADIRAFEPDRARHHDLIVLGAPVFYYDAPAYVKDWIKTLPELNGTPVAAFVTFGGPEGNQHNAACSILEALVQKEAVPAGMAAFMNMSAFPLAWSGEKVHPKTWMSRHLPNENTYNQVRAYAAQVLDQVQRGEALRLAKTLTPRQCATYIAPIWWTKLMVKNHRIDAGKCTGCGTCVDKCPVGAIDPSESAIDTDACVLCCGCVNNCPAGAVHMEYGGERVIGYREFMEWKQLTITEPEELAAGQS